MLKITDDAAHRALILEPSGPLAEADFAALAARFEARAAAGPVNLVINAAAFPGWTDFAAFASHLGFIRDHQRRVEKIALVSDSRLLDLAPRVADLVLAADIRHFPADALAAALAWAAEPEPERGGVEVIPGLPDDVLGLSAHGEVTARDYAETIRPLIEARLKAHPKLKLIYRLGPDFASYSAGAIWSDARLGFTHFSDFSKVAVVTDVGWIAGAVRIFAPLIPGEIQVFPDAEFANAKAWLSAKDAPAG